MPWPESWCPSKFICYNLISTVSKGTGLWTEHTQSHTHTHAHKPFHECDYCTQERVPGASDNLCLWNSALRCYSGASGSHQMIQLSGPWPSTSRAIFNPRLLLYQGLIFGWNSWDEQPHQAAPTLRVQQARDLSLSRKQGVKGTAGHVRAWCCVGLRGSPSPSR